MLNFRQAIPALIALSISSTVYAAENDWFDLTLRDLLKIKISSASKTEQEVKDIPASVTLITREEMARYGYVTLSDALKNIPGLYMVEDTESRFIGTRGNVFGGIQFLINGVPQHPSLLKVLTVPEIANTNIPIRSIDHIEFIRGPMSVIYGNNAFSGVINIVTNKADVQGDLLGAGYGTDDQGQLFSRTTSTFGNDGLFVLNLGAQRSERFDGNYSDMLSTADFNNLGPGMQRDMAGHFDEDNQNLDLFVSYGDFTATSRFSLMQYALYPTAPGLLSEDNSLDLTTWQQSLSYRHALNPQWTLSSTAIISHETYDLYEGGLIVSPSTITQKQTAGRQDFEQLAIYTFNQGSTLTSGYRYRHIDEVTSNNEVVIAGSLVPIPNRTVDPVITHEVFSDLSYALNQQWTLNAGLRYLRLPDAYQATFYSKPDGAVTTQDLTINDRNQQTYRLGAIYNYDRNQLIKLMYGTSAQDRNSFKFSEPEEIHSTELVYQYNETNWQLSTSLFRNITEKTEQRTVAIVNGTVRDTVTNNGEWETLGVEIIGEWRPQDNWRLSSSLSRQNTTNEKSQLDIPYSPHLLAKIKTDYQWGETNYSLNAFYVSDMKTELNYIDTDRSSVTPPVAVRNGDNADGYWNIGATIRHRLQPDLYLTANVTNLLDHEYRYPGIQVSSTLEKGLIAPGRIINFAIDWSF
jgi:outer membrane receptor protein involved in Fe transport